MLLFSLLCSGTAPAVAGTRVVDGFAALSRRHIQQVLAGNLHGRLSPALQRMILDVLMDLIGTELEATIKPRQCQALRSVPFVSIQGSMLQVMTGRVLVIDVCDHNICGSAHGVRRCAVVRTDWSVLGDRVDLVAHVLQKIPCDFLISICAFSAAVKFAAAHLSKTIVYIANSSESLLRMADGLVLSRVEVVPGTGLDPMRCLLFSEACPPAVLVAGPAEIRDDVRTMTELSFQELCSCIVDDRFLLVPKCSYEIELWQRSGDGGLHAYLSRFFRDVAEIGMSEAALLDEYEGVLPLESFVKVREMQEVLRQARWLLLADPL